MGVARVGGNDVARGVRRDGACAPSGAPCGADWIPAYAGMTVKGGMAMMGARG